MQRQVVNIILPKGEKEEYYNIKFVELMRYILDQHKEKVKFEQKNEAMKLIVKNDFGTPEKLVKFLIEFSEKVFQLFKREEKSKQSVN